MQCRINITVFLRSNYEENWIKRNWIAVAVFRSLCIFGKVSLVKEISNLNTTSRSNKVKWIDARVSVCSGTFLTSSSSSSSSTSRMPESCSSAWPPPRPLLSVDAACSLLLRRPMKGLGFEETELSKERWSCAWKQKYTLIIIITGTWNQSRYSFTVKPALTSRIPCNAFQTARGEERTTCFWHNIRAAEFLLRVQVKPLKPDVYWQPH